MVESDVTRSRSRDHKIERFIHFTSFKHRNLTPKTLSRQHHGTIVDRTYVVMFFIVFCVIMAVQTLDLGLLYRKHLTKKRSCSETH